MASHGYGKGSGGHNSKKAGYGGKPGRCRGSSGGKTGVRGK